MPRLKSRKAKIVYILVATAVVMTAGWFMIQLYLNWTRTPYVAGDYFGQFKTNQKVTIPIVLDTKEETINAAEVYLAFHPEEIRVGSVSRDNSFFRLWITNEPKFSNEDGQISFAGGLPSPGFKGKGVIGLITITPLKKGTFNINYDSKTRVLLNDGKGTKLSVRLNPIKIKVQ